MEPTIVVGLGEVLWDVFPDGARFGGAPANFARTVAALAGSSAEVSMVSAVGSDELGAKAVEELRQSGVDPRYVQVKNRPTGHVLVELDAAGQPSYEIASDVAWDDLTWSEDLGLLARRTDAVCFGTLAMRNEDSRRNIQAFLNETPKGCLRVFDLNLRSPFWDFNVICEGIASASVLKLNTDELGILADYHELMGDEIQLVRQVAQLGSIELVALTRGSKGSILYRRNGEYAVHPGYPVAVVDTVGAGDAFTATMVLGLLRGMPLDAIGEWANRVAGHVCSQAGASPPIPAHLMLPGTPTA